MGKTVVLAALVSILGACGRSGLDGNSCTVTDNGNGTATIACTDGTSYTVGNGKDGKDGASGPSCTVVKNLDGSTTITCPDGTSATVGVPQRGAKVTVAYNGPVAFSVPQGTAGVTPLNVAVTADADLTVSSTRLEIKAFDGNGLMVTNTTVYDFLKNIRIIDTVTGATVAGPMISASNWDFRASGTSVWAYLELKDDYELMAGETRHLAVVLDVDPAFPAGYSFKVVFSLRPDDAPWTTFIQDLARNCYLEADQLTGDPMVSSGTTVVSSSAPSNLSAVSVGNPDGGIVVAGTQMQLASKYRFSALSEGFNISKLTVINDESGAFDAPLNTVAVSMVTVRVPDMYGVTQTRTGSLSNGSVTFSSLDFYVPAGQDAFVEIFANVSTMADVGETLSGKTFRLGILDTGNTASTFEAVGATSSTATNNPAILNGVSVNSFTVRKSKLTLAKSSGLSTNLVNGQNRLYGFGACADNVGAVSFGKLTFEVAASSASLSDFHVVRGYVQLDPAQATITVVGNHVMVAFLQEETVSAGQCQDYRLDGTVTGAAVNSSVSTKLVISTGDYLGLLNPCANPNTGYVSGLGGTSIFLDPAGFVSQDVPGMELVWSDRSSNTHSYPVIASGLVTAGSGSCDWTNGEDVGTSLPTHTLTK